MRRHGERRGRRRRLGHRQPVPAGALTLGGVRQGARVRVVRVNGGRGLVHRLAALGIVPGARLTVTRSRGPALVSLNGARIAMGGQAALAVEVIEEDA